MGAPGGQVHHQGALSHHRVGPEAGHVPPALLEHVEQLDHFAHELRRDLVKVLLDDPKKFEKLQADLRARLDKDKS